MAAITPQIARSFVNTIVAEYDYKYHTLGERVSNVFDLKIPNESDKKEIQQIFYEEFTGSQYTEGSPDEQKKIFKDNVSSLSKLIAISGLLDIASVASSVNKNLQFVLPRVDRDLQLALVPEVKCETPLAEWREGRRKELEKQLEKHLHREESQKIKQAKEDAIEALIQAFLRDVNYELDPLTDARKQFFSWVYQAAYRGADTEGKKRIITQLESFKPQLESFSFKMQRMMFKIDGVFFQITKNRHVTFGLCVVAGVVSYFAINSLISLPSRFFYSSPVASVSSAVLNGLPVVVVQISSGIYNRITGIFAYVTSSQWYQWKIGPALICKAIPLMGFVFFPAFSIATEIFKLLHERSKGLEARVQMAISESLKNLRDRKLANELLEEGMKAYQVWMYLMQQGPEKGLFKEAAAS